MFRAIIDFFRLSRASSFNGECRCCGACCSNLILVDNGKPVQSIEKFEKLLRRKPDYSRFTPLQRDSDDGFLYFECTQLADNNRCMDYNNRPDICRQYPQKAMLRHGGRLLDGCGYFLKEQSSFARELERAEKKLSE